MPSDPSDSVTHALAYREQFGLPVFPVCSPLGDGTRCREEHWNKPNHRYEPCTGNNVGKTPLGPWKQFQSRLPTCEEISAAWTRWPYANIGMACGHLCGMCVLDIDGADGQVSLERRGYPSGGPVATSGRIGGFHRYFAWRDDAPTIFAKRDGLDFRGEGGFIILPPSRHRSGVQYRWLVPLQPDQPLPRLPDWVIDLAHEQPLRQQSGGQQTGPQPDPSGVANAGLKLTEGHRNDILARFAGQMRRPGFSEKAILAALQVTNAERCEPPLADDELAAIAASITRYAPGAPIETPPLSWTTQVTYG
jgi:hypothetical protein